MATKPRKGPSTSAVSYHLCNEHRDKARGPVFIRAPTALKGHCRHVDDSGGANRPCDRLGIHCDGRWGGADGDNPASATTRPPHLTPVQKHPRILRRSRNECQRERSNGGGRAETREAQKSRSSDDTSKSAIYESNIRSLRARLDAAKEVLSDQAQSGFEATSPQKMRRELEEMMLQFGKAESELATAKMQLHKAERRARDAESERDGLLEDAAKTRIILEETVFERDALRWERDALLRERDGLREEREVLQKECLAKLRDNQRSLCHVLSQPETHAEDPANSPLMASFRKTKAEKVEASPVDPTLTTDYKVLSEDLEEQLEVVKSEVVHLRSTLKAERHARAIADARLKRKGRDTPEEEVVRLRMRLGELVARRDEAEARCQDREDVVKRAAKTREGVMREVYEAQRRLEGRAAKLGRENRKLTEERDDLIRQRGFLEGKADVLAKRLAALAGERGAGELGGK